MENRVVSRYLAAAATRELARIEALLKDVEVALVDAERQTLVYPEPPKVDKDALARALSSAAGRAADAMFFEFEDPRMAEKVKKLLGRFNNLVKMLRQYAGAGTWDEMEKVLTFQRTKGKRVIEKFWEYRGDALGLIKYLSSEVVGHMDVGPYNVSLVSGSVGDWDEDSTDKLRHILERGDRLLSKAGMGQISGGRVLAFPSGKLPAGAFARYRLSDGLIQIAVGGSLQRVLEAFIHEMGHKAYFKLLGNRGRDAWERFFGDNVGVPDVDAFIRDWETYADSVESKGSWEGRYGRYLGYYLSYLDKHDPERKMWLNLIAEKVGINEQFDNISGTPKKNTVPGLEQLKAKKGEVQVFLYPVTAYSGKDAAELFAEAFSHYIVNGASSLPEIVRDTFREALPRFRGAATPRRRRQVWGG